MANRAQTRVIDAARAAIGPDIAVTDPDDLAPWLTDWRGRYHGAAPAMLMPRTTDQVSCIVTIAREHGVALVPQGGNTGVVGGATPSPDGTQLLLSTRRLRAIRSLSADANLAVAEAGVILADLHAAAEAQGRRFPLTLGARGSATIGGLVSTNAGGTQVLRFGTMRGLVAGVEAVLPDGTVHDGLAALKKDNRGYSLDQLLIGAEGTLGVVTAASLRLVPAIVGRAVAWVGVESPAAGLALLRRIEARTSAVESFEIVDNASLAMAIAHVPGIRSPLEGEHRWHALIEAVSTDIDGQTAIAVLEPILGVALEAGAIDDAVIAASEAQADAFWRIRDSLSEAERASGPATQHDISVPVDAMPRFMIDAAAACEARFAGTMGTSFGHLGDGNVHFHVRAPADMSAERWYADYAADVSRFVNDLVTAAGGSISAEHGIGQLKLDELERLSSPARIAALRAVKSAFDPDNLFNPGKLVRLAPARAAP